MKRKQKIGSEVRSLYEYKRTFFPKSYEEQAREKELLGQGIVLSNDALQKLRNALAGVN